MLSHIGRMQQPAAGAVASSSMRVLAPCMRRVGGQLQRYYHGQDLPSHVCQAHPRRVAKVTSQIQREISEMFIYDDVLQKAICPERGQGNSLSAIAGVTHVYVSNDLQVVKAYVSIYSDARGKAQAMANLKRLEPYVRGQIGQRVQLRLTPEVRFEYDDSIEEAELVQQVLGPEEYDRLSRLAAGEREDDIAVSNVGAVTSRGDDDGDDSGFFDLGDAEEDGDYAAGVRKEAGTVSKVPSAAAGAGAGAAQLEGAAAEEDEEEDEYDDMDDLGEEEAYKGRWYDQPGPFDDLFGDVDGEGDVEVTARGGGRGRGAQGRQGRQGGRQGGQRRGQKGGRS